MTPPRLVPTLPWTADARLAIPGSKSSANRLLVAAALSGRALTLHGVPAADDVVHMVHGLRAFGFALRFEPARERIDFEPAGPARLAAAGPVEIFCGNAGTTLRFLTSLAAVTPGEWTLTGDAAMRQRPIGALVTALRQLGADVRDTNGCPPVRVRTTTVPAGGRVELDASQSSQFLSSLLLVGAALRAGIDVHVTGPLASRDYVTLTCRELARLHVRTETTDHGVRVLPGFGKGPAELDVDGDWSSLGVWTCLNHLTGSRIAATNPPPPDAQPDAVLAGVLRALPEHGEHTIDVGAFPDQFCNLAVVAACRSGTTRFTGGANLRIKESDRIAVMARELRKIGADAQELADGLVVRGGRALHAAIVDPERDHRIAIALALAGLLTPGIAIGEPDCVAKSYPRFWQHLAQVVAHPRCVAVVGMRGAGKSTFARALARTAGLVVHDTDTRFVAEHGAIAPFVASHGWSAFRTHEERFVAEALLPGTVVSTGGGAIESAAGRALLRERAFVVWLTAPAALLRARLAADAGQRPSITGAPVLDEIEPLLARREPLYAEAAHLRIDAALPVEQQVAAALRGLRQHGRWPGSAAPA
ncbi:MAG: 3-phosphoshikimate 1-carboxyvinyltransferase [Planctomycetota bacterium]